MESAAPLVYNVYRTCAMGQLRAMVQAPCSRVGEAGRPGGQRRSDRAAGLSALVGWHCGAATQRARRCRPSSVVCISDRRCSILRVHLSSPLRLSIRAYSEQERRAGGVGEAPNLPSRLAVPIKDISE